MKSPAVGRLRLTTRVVGFSTVIVWMALSEERSGLFLVCSRLNSTSVAVTGSPLENAMFGRMCSVTMEGLSIVQLWATPGAMLVLVSGAATDSKMFWYTV